MMFYEITEVTLYFDSTSSAGKAEEASALDVRILDYDNPENDKNRNKGALCKPAPIDVARQKERKYVCVGTKVTSFPGQFVTILQKEDFLIKIAEVYVAGKISTVRTRHSRMTMAITRLKFWTRVVR